jgi:MoxR-like ATPase
MTDSPLRRHYQALHQEIRKVVCGQEQLIEQALLGFFAGGHIILEGVPGLAKTLFAKTLAATLSLTCKRVQFTPDLMPSDLVGTNIFRPDEQAFRFLPGPVFCDVLLADEINRTPPKTQSALLEAMEEKQVTVDGQNHVLPPHFFVIATQNPIEHEGTFPLPEAQLDRFLLKIKIGYPTAEDEMTLLRQPAVAGDISTRVAPILKAEDLMEIRRSLQSIRVDDTIYHYLLQLLATSRQSSQIALGASPRAGLGWLQAARALAALRGRDFVTPDDIKETAAPILRHRMLLKPETEIEGVSVEQVIETLLASVEVPR